MDDEYTSGPWTGFYLYANGKRERMDLSLTFREGKITGGGSDPVGAFLIQGRYDAEKGEVWWTKTYLGAHDVFYKGCRDTRGIWGTWEIHAAWKGGFHIWPRGQGEGAAEEAEADVEEPVEAVAKGPAGPPEPPSLPRWC